MEHQGLHSLLGHPWNGTYTTPLRIYNQHFGNTLMDEDLPPLDTWAMMQPHRKIYPHSESGISQISCTQDEFQVKLDVHQFRQEELTVKVIENYVVVEGKHDDREDEHGFITRHFKRRYRLPDNVKDDRLLVDLSSDSILQIRAPRMAEAQHDPAMKVLPIHQTGKPSVISGVIQKGSDTAGHHFHSLHA